MTREDSNNIRYEHQAHIDSKGRLIHPYFNGPGKILRHAIKPGTHMVVKPYGLKVPSVFEVVSYDNAGNWILVEVD